ncbi:MAG: electron transfer flavoprotein subunit beta/FixA family protein [bacterium]
MSNIVVLVKQVPDTANITGDAMKEDGTVNRGALPAVFNPEDLNALEMALSVKEKTGWRVHVITMGPSKAAEVLRYARYMGADEVVLISDRKFAAADTLATSYVLSEAVKKIGDVKVVFAGRQAIDGDTAQVGPQVAEKIDFDQLTYVTAIDEINEDYVIAERDGGYQHEKIKLNLPVLLTVTESANEPRYPSAKGMLEFFRARPENELSGEEGKRATANGWIIPVWNVDKLGLDVEKCGLKGSPTKVFRIKSISLAGGDLEIFDDGNKGVQALVKSIMKDYVEVD